MLHRKGKIKNWFRRIGPRITVCYLLIALLTVITTTVVYRNISLSYAKKQVSTAEKQTLATVQVNVKQMLENANNYSKLIFSNSYLQSLLRSGDVNSDLALQSRVSTFLFNLMQAVPIIESIYIYDFTGHHFRVSARQPEEFVYERVEDAGWYDDVMAKKGIYVLALKGDGAFTNSDSGRFLTMARLIRDVNYTNNLGIMALNISESSFADIYADPLSSNAMSIAVFDEEGQCVMRLGECTEEKEVFLQECVATEYDSEAENMVEFEGMDALVVMLLLILSVVIFLISSVLIFRLFTKPIDHLLATMTSAQEGNYNEITGKATSLEFELLYQQYNHMMSRLKSLHEQHIQEQETVRKAELSVLQAQIKPHFLYNTLDSIIALAMMGDNDKVCQLSEALSGYYRLSVSKGKDVIYLREDLQILQNYMIIQQIRYREMYQIHYDVDATCLGAMIPKLVLQPLVENALYHGLRARYAHGNIYLSIHRLGEKIEIRIEDDGVGMTQERVREILEGERHGDVASFGLWGTLERIRIYYGEKSSYKIESEPDEGTTITLIIPEVTG